MEKNFELFKFAKTIEDMLDEQKKGSELFVISGNQDKLKNTVHDVLKGQGINIEKDNIHMNEHDKFKKCKELKINKYFDDSWGHIKTIYSESQKGNIPDLEELFYAVPDFYEKDTIKKGLHFKIDLTKDLEQQKSKIEEELKKDF